jgi:hypothetical protein
VVYHLLSYDRTQDVRIKVPLGLRNWKLLPASQGSSQPQAAVDLDRPAGAIVVLQDEERRPPDFFGLT